ncbi:hypothetical protein XH94_23710 [Bradyrhizobium zhanjiangense]|uniref:Uncharacterized protein n=1 Tax=Bradyrhizobium zhanjiangense TaxID=1325107 RepID=A0A4Q0SFH1_9BRAD|nr:hypothetical protein XH94_23710 [Bradyrhizobium zhanjiangense]
MVVARCPFHLSGLDRINKVPVCGGRFIAGAWGSPPYVLWRVLLDLRDHAGGVGRARNAPRAEQLTRNVILGSFRLDAVDGPLSHGSDLL